MVTTDSKHAHPVAPNVLERDFEATAPNQKWLADLTYVPTDEGWLYLALVLDLFARKLVGWAMSMRSANPPCRPFPAAVRRSYAAAVRTVSSTGWAGACQLCGNSVAKSLFFSVGSRSKTSFR